MIFREDAIPFGESIFLVSCMLIIFIKYLNSTLLFANLIEDLIKETSMDVRYYLVRNRRGALSQVKPVEFGLLHRRIDMQSPG